MVFLLITIFIIKKDRMNSGMILKIGSAEAEAIKAVQRKLGLVEDGSFGPKTEMAVREYQRKNNLPIDGIVTELLASMLGINIVLLINPTYQLTVGSLKLVSGMNNITLLSEITKELNLTLIKYKIDTPLRVAHFISQILHESGNFTITKENMNYSTKRLLEIFGKYFPNATIAEQYARQPEKIANKVYGNRMGNGPISTNDGYNYRGRGYIQCTGLDSYKALSTDLGVDFITHPELLETVKYACLSAGWEWDKSRLNLLADKGNTDEIITNITKKINGGYNGLEDRINKFRLCEKIIK